MRLREEPAAAAFDRFSIAHSASSDVMRVAGRAHGHRDEVAIRWIPATETTFAAEIWRDLERRMEDEGLTRSWVWTETWLQHYGDLVSHRFAVGEDDTGPCGIALVTWSTNRRRGPFRVTSVHLGTAGEPATESVYVEYNRVLVEPHRRAAFARAILRDLRRVGGWHEFVLDGFAPEEAEPFLSAEPRFIVRREVCPTTILEHADATRGDVLATLTASTRKKLRRSLRALGDVETEWAETPEQALSILEDLIDLHQRRWRSVGQPGAFASVRFTGFHRALVQRLVPKGLVVLFRVRAGGETVGCEYGFVERGRALVYQSGVASYDDPGIRPGFVADALCMQACYERGLREYDFLAGDSMYKRQLTTGERAVVWATWRRPALRWTALDLLGRLRARVVDPDA